MKEVKIYVLKNPETNKIHYVGRSVSPNVRYRQHIHLAKRSKHKDRKNAWICSLLTKNLKPLMEIIECVTQESAVEREMYWIKELKKTCDLKNDRDYVENNYLFSEESRKRMSDSHKGKKLTQEQKEKIGIASKGNKHKLGVKQSEEFKKKVSKIVLQYNKDGTFVKEWPSTKEVERCLGLKQGLISVTALGRKYRKTCGGYIWKYKK